MLLLAALVLSSYLWSTQHVDVGRDPAAMAPQPPLPAWRPTPDAGRPVTVKSPIELLRLKIEDLCSRADTDLNGYLSESEFALLGKSAANFQTADVDHDGQLNLEECERALDSS